MPKITINGKEYDFENGDDLKRLMQAAGKNADGSSKISIIGNPDIKVSTDKNILKMYGMDMNNLESPKDGDQFETMPTGKNDASNGSASGKSFGGSSFSGSSDSSFSSGTSDEDIQKLFKKSNGTRWITWVVVLLCIGGFVGMFFAIGGITQSWEETYALSGDPTHFDPIASVNEMRSHFDPTAKLSSIEMDYVGADGTMDLTAKYNANTTYKFYREVPTPKDAPPVGAGGSAAGKWYEPVEADVYQPGQWRHVSKMGGGVNAEYDYSNKGIDLNRDDPTATPDTFIDDPKCSIKDFWKIANQKGAPAGSVATINYDDSGYGFSISNTDVNLQFNKDCTLNTN